jgi:hypothetical protein
VGRKRGSSVALLFTARLLGCSLKKFIFNSVGVEKERIPNAEAGHAAFFSFLAKPLTGNTGQPCHPTYRDKLLMCHTLIVGGT